MKLNEVEPKLKELEQGVDGAHLQIGQLEKRIEQVASQIPQTGTDTPEVSDPDSPDYTPSEELDVHASAGATDATYDTLKAAIAGDVREYDASVLSQALLHEVVAPKDDKQRCREEVMCMETGEMHKMQPFRFTDAKYDVVSREMLDRILKETQVDQIKWVEEKMDCEKIARKFVTLATDLGVDSVGRVKSWSGGHAFCIAAVQDGASVDFVFFEPQNDKIITEFEGNYDMSNALIIIS